MIIGVPVTQRISAVVQMKLDRNRSYELLSTGSTDSLQSHVDPKTNHIAGLTLNCGTRMTKKARKTDNVDCRDEIHSKGIHWN